MARSAQVPGYGPYTAISHVLAPDHIGNLRSIRIDYNKGKILRQLGFNKTLLVN